MKTTKKMTTKKMTIRQITKATAEKAEGTREEYCWYFLRETFPGASEEALARWAGMILGITGK